MKLNHSVRTAAQDGVPFPGRWTAAEPGDRARWLQTSEYTPANVTRILEAANEGDIAELAVAAREILERNWEVIMAMQVRKSALTGLDWGVEPGDGRPASKDAAKAFETALKEAGSDVVFYKEYPGVPHDCWTRTYRDPEVWKWLFSQKRGVLSDVRPEQGEVATVTQEEFDAGF